MDAARRERISLALFNLQQGLLSMPIYEYECENCGNRFERFQSVRDAPVCQCPQCAGRVHKVLHPAGIIFKGSGWYITDSRKTTSSATGGETKSNGGAAKADATTNGSGASAETKPTPTPTPTAH